MRNDNYLIYIHTAPNGKMYIGQTNNIKKRWAGNGNRYKTQSLFHKAILKYGWNNIEHKIISTNLTKEEADFQEMFYISAYNTTNIKFGYNITKGGAGVGLSGEKNGMYGKHHTEESKLLMKLHLPKICVKRRKPILQLDKDGNIINEFDSIKSAAEELNLSKGNICGCCKGINKTCGGYKFEYKSR